MQIYLPIAEVSVNGLGLLLIGAMVGLLSGMFGVGGGFILTPLLFFIGIPPAVAVASAANQIAGSSFSAFLGASPPQDRRLQMGAVLLAGGLLGSLARGADLHPPAHARPVRAGRQPALRRPARHHRRADADRERPRRCAAATTPTRVLIPRRRHTWAHGLPLKMRFHTSKLYVSAIPPFVIGACVGILAAIMGVGGGFIMVPAMIYLIGMPTKVVVGTSVFQFLFVTGFTAVLHAIQSGTVDVHAGADPAGRRRHRRADRRRPRGPAPRRAAAHPARAARRRGLPQALRRPRAPARRALSRSEPREPMLRLAALLLALAGAGWRRRRPWSPASPPTTSRSTPTSTAPSSSSSARSAATRPPPPDAGPLDIIITIKGPPGPREGAPQGAPASASG